jgi:hypothetical protein
MSEQSDSTLRFEFENCFGERWEVVIDPQDRSGVLRGDETGWEPVSIRDGRIESEFGLSGEEYRCLAEIWRRATGEDLEPTWLNQLERLLRNRDPGDGN